MGGAGAFREVRGRTRERLSSDLHDPRQLLHLKDPADPPIAEVEEPHPLTADREAALPDPVVLYAQDDDTSAVAEILEGLSYGRTSSKSVTRSK